MKTLVLTDITAFPLRMPLAFLAAAVLVFLSLLQGAYVLWYNADHEIRTLRDSAAASAAEASAQNNVVIGWNTIDTVYPGGCFGVHIGSIGQEEKPTSP